MRRNPLISFFILVLLCHLALSCATQRKLKYIGEENVAASIQLPKEKQFQAPEIKKSKQKDTIKVVDFEGKEMFLMKTIVDESGEAVANQVLDAAVVTARFRNMAERGGKVDLAFQIIVPEKLRDSRWQLRYIPKMFILQDSVELDMVLLTGDEYRKKQTRGYQQYQRFLDRIITDTTRFIDVGHLEIFLQRNIPQVYAFKTDSSFVSDEQFNGMFGVTEREAIDHYTRQFLIRKNNRLKSLREKKYKRYVKSPYITEGLRLDTVVKNTVGNYIYEYVQTVDTRNKKKLKKVDIVLDGMIYEQENCLYKLPRTEPLTFYISSLSAFVDGTERYITRIVERRASAAATYNIDFPVGKSDIVMNFGKNADEISKIKSQLNYLLDNKAFDLDSVVVVASAYPEGSVAANGALSHKRGESISTYFNRFMKQQIDSLNREDGLSFNLDETFQEQKKEKRQPISFRSRAEAENWTGLNRLVEADTVMNITQKDNYYALLDVKDPDAREARMRNEPWYSHMRTNLYPKLRTVQFQFILHRKGMIKDTIHTTEIDSVYMSGVQAIRDRDYELAINLLTPYNDYNLAVAYCAQDKNYSALQILEKCEQTAEVKYMLAIIYSRFGDDQKAVQSYLDACHMAPQYVHRGNLDPEIAVLIKKYNLNKQDDEDLGF